MRKLRLTPWTDFARFTEWRGSYYYYPVLALHAKTTQTLWFPFFSGPPTFPTSCLWPCLFVFMYSINHQSIKPPKSQARHQLLQPWMLKQLSAANLWLLSSPKKRRCRKMIICIAANLSRQILAYKMNAVKPWRDGRFCVHMPKCVRNSSPHLSFNDATGCHLAFTRVSWWEGGEGGDGCCYPSLPSLSLSLSPLKNRPWSFVSFLAAASLSCHDTLSESYAK